MNIPKYMTEFRNELQRKGYRDNSIKNYVSCVESFLNHFNSDVTEPIKVNESQIKDYLRVFTEHNTQRSVHSAIKTFYKYVCRQPEKFKYIEYCKRSRKLPIVFSFAIHFIQLSIIGSSSNEIISAVTLLMFFGPILKSCTIVIMFKGVVATEFDPTFISLFFLSKQ